MARVRVTDPYSGVTLTVEDDSPQAKAWGGSSDRSTEQEPQEDPVTPIRRKPGRPKKTEE